MLIIFSSLILTCRVQTLCVVCTAFDFPKRALSCYTPRQRRIIIIVLSAAAFLLKHSCLSVFRLSVFAAEDTSVLYPAVDLPRLCPFGAAPEYPQRCISSVCSGISQSGERQLFVPPPLPALPIILSAAEKIPFAERLTDIALNNISSAPLQLSPTVKPVAGNSTASAMT